MKIVNPNILLAFFYWTMIPSEFVGQQKSILNQASYNLFSLNPSAIGLTKGIQTHLNYKKNWTGFAASPEITQVSIDGQIADGKQGFGLMLNNERVGIFLNTSFNIAFRHRIKLSKNHNIDFGISGGFERQTVDFSKINAEKPDEFDSWTRIQFRTIPDASIGLTYSYKRFKLLFSANKLLNQNFVYQETGHNHIVLYKSLSHFSLVFQRDFHNKKNTWLYTPNLIIRSSLGLPLQFDFLNTVSYTNNLFLGVGYRSYFAIYGNIGFGLNDKLRVIYSYEYSHKINAFAGRGHEIGLYFSVLPKKSDKLKTDIISHSKSNEKKSIPIKTETAADKNLEKMKTEFWDLITMQVSPQEIIKLIASAETQDNKTRKTSFKKYNVIQKKLIPNCEKTSSNNKQQYELIYGAYNTLAEAKKMQQFLNREFNIKTSLKQLDGLDEKTICVASPEAFLEIKLCTETLLKYNKLVSDRFTNEITVDSWILQTQNTKP